MTTGDNASSFSDSAASGEKLHVADSRLPRADAPRSSDDRVLELREQGRSFSAITKLVGFEKATEAPTAFNRALRRRPKKDQAALGKAETARLDQLEKTVRADADLGDVETARKLKAVDRLRSLTLKK